MIPRLWQCERPVWWEHLLGAPLSSYAFLVLLGAYLYLRAAGWRKQAALVLRVWLVLILGNVAILGMGFLAGIVLRLIGANPSDAYELARGAWLITGWPLVALVIWRFSTKSWQVPPVRPDSPLRFAGHLSLALLAILVVLMAPLLGFLRHSQSVRMARDIAEHFFDSSTTLFATNECLYEHKLEYLSWWDDPYDHGFGPVQRLPGSFIGMELGARRALDPDPAVRAFRSYRQKVIRGEVRDPSSFDGLSFPDDPRQIAELRAWAADPRHSDQSRDLARKTLDEILHPKPPPLPQDTERFMLRPRVRRQ